MKIRKTELLAPAKNKETAIEAINCGADAVYIGADLFGARKNAGNSLEDIQEVVNYAHKYWAKVFITLNTILTDSELPMAVELAYKLQKIGVDAILIQDMGLLNEFIKSFKNTSNAAQFHTPIHMSTQCDNYSPEKIKFFNNIGVSRVVLARETSLDQITQIHKGNPELELEGFVHGALCVSMSGQCYLSESIGGRSANRGECAQPCRKQYNIETTDGEILKENTYALCLKDFNTSNLLDEMKNAGIYSFKIEGRLKDIGYVKNIVAYYRQKLGKGISSGKSDYSFIPNPNKSFNRGFTEYFLKGRTDCYNMQSPKSKGEYVGKVTKLQKDGFILKTTMELHAGDGLYCEGDGCNINQVVKLSSNNKNSTEIQTYKIVTNKPMKLKIGADVYRNSDIEFEKQLAKPVKRQIGAVLSITEKSAQELLLSLTDENSINITKTIIKNEIAKNQEKMKETWIKQFSKTGSSDFYIDKIEISNSLELPFLPISEINDLRRIMLEELMEKRIEHYNTFIKEVQKPIKYAKYCIDEVDYRANVHNKSAYDFYAKCGTNVKEYSYELNKPNRQVALMKCKHCIKYALNMCKSNKNLILRDTHGQTYPLKFNCKDCEMYVISN